jgi:nucleotide-binding universal stress UspA family protein
VLFFHQVFWRDFMRNRLIDTRSLVRRLNDFSISFADSRPELPTTLCQHILVPVTPTDAERSTAIMALHLGGLLQARVTFLQVCPPPPEQSLHWLDAIDQLHEGLSGRARCAGEDEEDQPVRAVQMTMVEWIKREIPEPLRNQVEISVEARLGDFAGEVVRYANEKSVDLLILRRVTSRWGRPVLPRPARRILKRTHTPAILVHPDAQQFASFKVRETSPAIGETGPADTQPE